MKMRKLFKPGDRVQLKSGGPVMIVQKYLSDYMVECSMVDSKGYHKKIIHQNSLRRYIYNLNPVKGTGNQINL